MSNEQIQLIQKKPYLFMVAAVSDYLPKYKQDKKLKKELLGENFKLDLKQNIDILKTIDKDGIITIGFKAEMDKENALKNASKMIESKNIDAVCLNLLQNSSSFGSDTNKIDFITAQNIELLKENDKISLAFDILTHAKKINDE